MTTDYKQLNERFTTKQSHLDMFTNTNPLFKLFDYVDFNQLVEKFNQTYNQTLFENMDGTSATKSIAAIRALNATFNSILIISSNSLYIMSDKGWINLGTIRKSDIADFYVAHLNYITNLNLDVISKLTSNYYNTINKMTLHNKVIQFNDCYRDNFGNIIEGYYRDSLPNNNINRDAWKVFQTRKLSTFNKAVDFLLKVHADYDNDTYLKMIQTEGLDLVNVASIRSKFGILPIFFGPNGENGKSTRFSLKARAYGSENVKSVSVKNLAKYSLATFIDALVIYDDDVASNFLESDTSEVLKKLATGEQLEIRQIYQAPRTVVPTNNIYLLTNHNIKAEDKSNGWNRRIEIYPIKNKLVNEIIKEINNNQTWSSVDAFFNELLSDDAAQYYFELIFLESVKIIDDGVQKLPLTKQMTDSRELLDLENNNVLLYIETEDLTELNFINMPIAEPYTNYTEFCEKNKEKPYSKNRFSQEIQLKFNLSSKKVYASKLNDQSHAHMKYQLSGINPKVQAFMPE